MQRFIYQSIQVFRIELECDVCDTLTTANSAIACIVSALICHSYFSHLMSIMTGYLTGSVIIESSRLCRASQYRPMITEHVINEPPSESLHRARLLGIIR